MLTRVFKKVGCIVLISMMLAHTTEAQVIQFSQERVVDVPTQIKQGYTLVELKTIVQMMDLEVVWNQNDKSIKIMDIGNTLTLYLGKVKALFNDKEFELETAPIAIEGCTYIPLRVVAEQFGYKVTSNEGRIILSRSLSEEEKELLDTWKSELACHFSLLFSIDSLNLEELPMEEIKKSIQTQSKNIKAVLDNPRSSLLIKVFAQEYISALQAIDSVYNLAENKSGEFENHCNRAMHKIEYLSYEYECIGYERHSELLAKQDFISPSYDEERVSLGYSRSYSWIQGVFKQSQKDYLENKVYISEVSSRISNVVGWREQLKHIRGITRCQGAKDIVDTYIAYADLVIAYYCGVRRNPNQAEKINKQYETALLEAEKLVEEAYNKYISFGGDN